METRPLATAWPASAQAGQEVVFQGVSKTSTGYTVTLQHGIGVGQLAPLADIPVIADLTPFHVRYSVGVKKWFHPCDGHMQGTTWHMEQDGNMAWLGRRTSGTSGTSSPGTSIGREGKEGQFKLTVAMGP